MPLYHAQQVMKALPDAGTEVLVLSLERRMVVVVVMTTTTMTVTTATTMTTF